MKIRMLIFEHVRTGFSSRPDFPLSELRKLEEGGESFCSCMGLDTSPLKAPMNEIVWCCLLCLTSPETVPVRIKKLFCVGVAVQGVVSETLNLLRTASFKFPFWFVTSSVLICY